MNKFIDITYRPFIRDSVLEDINIKNPIFDIEGYKPKYTSREDTEDKKEDKSKGESISQEEETVTSNENAEEVSNTSNTPATSSTPISTRFTSKDEYRRVMTPIYESELVKRGLDKSFARLLVAQDGLESAWGSKPTGNYNFGGIKGKGRTMRTREVINGKDTYINDSFRDFSSPEEYVGYKIDLLNGARYRAFSGGLSEFTNRVARGGYATDPNYAKALNRVISSLKRGGTFKFQKGGVTEAQDWFTKWLNDRKDQLLENALYSDSMFSPISRHWEVKRMNDRVRNVKIDYSPQRLERRGKGYTVEASYSPSLHRITLKGDDDPSNIVHELTHSSDPRYPVSKIKHLQDIYGDNFYDSNNRVVPDKDYYDDPEEIFCRVMQLRHHLGVSPDYKFTNEEVENLKESVTRKHELLRGEGTNESITVINPDGTIDYNTSIRPFDNINDKNIRYWRNYKGVDETFNILNRYSTDAIRRLLNEVAKNDSRKDLSLYAKLGLKIFK